MMKLLLKRGVFLFIFVIFSSPYAQTFRGELGVMVFDYFNKNKTTTQYSLHEGDETYELDLPKMLDKNNLLTGEHVIVEGTLIPGVKQNRIQVDSITLEKSARPKPDITGNRTVLTLLVNFNNIKVTDTHSTSSVDAQLYTNRFSSRRNHNISSFGQLSYVRDPNIPSIYVVNLNYDAGSACNANTWGKDAETAATQAGIDIAAYTHHMFILPKNVHCPWGGVAYVGCKPPNFCKSWVIGYNDMTRIMAHELGHNLGMAHAASDLNNAGSIDQYGDESCVMGRGYKQINAPHRDQMHWFDTRPQNIKTVTATAGYKIYSLDITTNALQVLKINKKDQSGTYYVSYRTNTILFGMDDPYKNRVNIHRTVPGNTYSYFITSLGNSETFTDANNGISITAVATQLSNAARVDVSLAP